MAKSSKNKKPVKKANAKAGKKVSKPKTSSKPKPKVKKASVKKPSAKKPATVKKKAAPKPAKVNKPAPKPVKESPVVKAKVVSANPLPKGTYKPINPAAYKPETTFKPIGRRRRPSGDPKKGGAPKPNAKPKKEVAAKGKPEVKKKKKVTLESILNQPKQPIFVKKAELPKISYPSVTSGKKQFKIEYEMKSSPHLLYNYLSNASGLAAWFANDVNIRDGVYTFFWNGSTARAKVIAQREDLIIAYQWMDETDGSYFVFEIVQDDITGDVALIVTDFAFPNELEQNRMLWNSQINGLSQVIGS